MISNIRKNCDVSSLGDEKTGIALYADDTTLIANSASKLQVAVNEVI